MGSKSILIILAGFAAGVIAIAFGMMAGQDWEKPGTYAGISDASHAPKSTTDCYSFQTGCKNIKSTFTQSEMQSGAELSGNFKP